MPMRSQLSLALSVPILLNSTAFQQNQTGTKHTVTALAGVSSVEQGAQQLTVTESQPKKANGAASASLQGFMPVLRSMDTEFSP